MVKIAILPAVLNGRTFGLSP